MLCSLRAWPLTLLLETVANTAARDPVRVSFELVSLDGGTANTYAVVLPGSAPEGSPFVFTSDDAALAVTRLAAPLDSSVISGVSLGAPTVARDGVRTSGLLNPRFLGIAAGDSVHPPRAILVGERVGAPNGLGSIEAWAFNAGPPLSISTTPTTWILPGTPAAGALNPAGNWLAVLCLAPSGATVLHAREVVRGGVIKERVPVADADQLMTPAGLALIHDGQTLLALLNDTDAENGGGDGRSWCVPIDARSFEVIGEPLELSGTVGHTAAVVESGAGAWITTRTPGAGFAFLTRIQRTDTGFERSAPISYTGATQELVIAASGEAVAVGVGRTLQIARDGNPSGASNSFGAPVRALTWFEDMVLVAEGNRLHFIRANDGAVLHMLTVQSGIISGIHVLDAGAVNLKDSDRDAIPDALDPEPALPSPSVSVPPFVALHSEAAGREVRAVPVNSPHLGDTYWRVDHDAAAAPWLRVYPKQGKAPAWFVMGVDPAQAPPERVLTAEVNVHLSGSTVLTPAAHSPQRLRVRMVPRSAYATTALWILATESGGLRSSGRPRSYAGLADLLARAPFYWSHVGTEGRAVGAIAPYAVVVIDTDAIEAGVVTRHAVLEYVAAGGGLLVVARANAGAATAQRWLAPLGITIEDAAPRALAASTLANHPAVRHWNPAPLPDVASLQVDESVTVLAAAADGPALVARSYGRGRIAVLASPYPLQSGLDTADNRLFAADLFEWLSRGILETKDLDADGLIDSIEDKNGNGVVDRGETAALLPDTDGDAVPDGDEDRNANGRVDDGETNPLIADTDGDGDMDGADYDPLPPLGAPTALSLAPDTGPAEGGFRVTVDGRNLVPDAQVWFGARQATVLSVSSDGALVVEAPPNELPDGGAVDVRVESPGYPGTILPGGFVYGPRSAVRLMLEAVTAATGEPEGIVVLSVDTPPGIQVGRVAVRIDSEPAGELDWYELRATAEAAVAGRRVVQRETDEWGIAFDLSPPNRTPDAVALARVRCRLRNPVAGVAATRVVLRDTAVFAANGEPLDVLTMDATLHWPSAAGNSSLPSDQP